jgi:hypothetical protein
MPHARHTDQKTFPKLIYKPSGRNLFSLSLGVPTVLFPYVR